MNAHLMIPHRMFVAALSGDRYAPAAPSGPPVQVVVESTPDAAGLSLREKRRDEAVSALALRSVFESGLRYGM
jgi:hypothetical protein